MAAKAIWHSEICPDVQSSSPSEANTTAKPMPVVYWLTYADWTTKGMAMAMPIPATAPVARTGGGKVVAGRSLRTASAPRVISLARGTRSSAPTNTRNGIWV